MTIQIRQYNVVVVAVDFNGVNGDFDNDNEEDSDDNNNNNELMMTEIFLFIKTTIAMVVTKR